MADQRLELELLRHASLPERLDFEIDGAAYFARLVTAPAAISPAYMLHEASGESLAQVVLPSVLEDVELHLLSWLVAYTHASAR